MHLNKQLKQKTRVYGRRSPHHGLLIFLLSITVTPLDSGTLVLFLFGAVLLVVGMGLFTLGVDMSMLPMGEGVGSVVSQNKGVLIPVAIYFVLGALTTMAEPDLQVLAQQVPSIENIVLVLTVAVGVGLFLVVASPTHQEGHSPAPSADAFFTAVVFLLFHFSPPTTLFLSPSTRAASPPAPLPSPLSCPWALVLPPAAATKIPPVTASA